MRALADPSDRVRSGGAHDDGFRDVVQAVPDGILVVDRHGTVLFANPAAARLFARSPETLLGLPLGLPLVRADDVAELDVVRSDGTVVVVEMHVAEVSWRGADVRVVTLRDLTDRLTAERLALSEQRYALSARGANDGMWDWERAAGRVFTSSRLREILGWPATEMSEPVEWWLELVHPEDADSLLRAVDEHVAGRTARLSHECRLRCRDGSWRWVLVRGVAVTEHGSAVRFAGSLSDVSDRKRVEQDLMRLALHDPLTGLANRALFVDRLSGAIDRARREGRRFALLFFDLDHFKVVNDSLGHAVGDAVLVEVGRRVQSCVRATDTLARLGGDEFAVLLDRPESLERVLVTVGRIQAQLAAPVAVGSDVVRATASIGVVTSDDLPPDPDLALRFADIAMYHAKAKGPNSFGVFAATMRAEMESRVQQHERLLRAERRGDLFVRYQPVVGLDDGRIVGFEALLRWRVEKGRVLDAGEFLHIAEETGVIVPAGWTALGVACRQVGEWRDAGFGVAVSVNLGEHQLTQPDVAERVAGALGRVGVEGSSLRLEIGERALLSLPRAGFEQLERCRNLGVEIMVDDLATGATSLGALGRLPVTGVKIDRSFVRRLEDRRSHRLVRALVGFARDLGLDVIAEGVETPDQRQRLLDLGCGLGQGYLFGAAVDPDGATRALHDQGRAEGPGAGRAD